MADIQISDIKMPTLRELSTTTTPKVDNNFKFTLLSQLDQSGIKG